MPIEELTGGSITSPQGFLAGATYAGIKKPGDGVLDLAILTSEAPCHAAALFTTNKIKAAPVLLSRERVKSGGTLAVVVNSGCANACTGRQGLKDAREITGAVAEGMCARPEQVLAASTGVIGVPLPMERIRQDLGMIVLAADGGHGFARAIMTTDTRPKEIAVSVRAEESPLVPLSQRGRRIAEESPLGPLFERGKRVSFTVAGAAKGSGMIHPDLATMLCFLTTDAVVRPDFLHRALTKAVGNSLNMVSVDGDSSTNDSVFLLANGMAGNEEIGPRSPLAGVFQEALDRVCIYLAKSIARDGEGATRRIEVQVKGARNTGDARKAARCIAGSSLVKAAVHGNDPNWGRIVAALGRSGAEVRESRIDLRLNGFALMKKGEPQPFDEQEVSQKMAAEQVDIALDLHLGRGQATAWGCDLSEEYVTINSVYTT
ncbi:MAG: bifunctional ornithine acetyltransferase/N-acetylglutamate synthase [Chloroflexi bacterium]|nr:bifunctional ornithine acetyltransferase/N-acetylglutamate synthase [Chloroflexota bacterium]